jgi:hypothetical protein
LNPLAIAFSVVLGCSAILAAMIVGRARPSSRDYLRFAAALYLALALCMGLSAVDASAAAAALSGAVTLVVSALAPTALAFALFATFEHPPAGWIAGVSLVLACIAGIAAAATGERMLALAPLSMSVLAMLALCLRRWRMEKRASAHAFLSACCLICAVAAAFTKGDGTAQVLFLSAALLGFGLALARRSRPVVENGRDLRQPMAIGEKN